MSGMLNSVDQRTQLVGQNRLELLLFKLNTTQIFAINVFKVKEILKVPKLTKLPGSHYHISGVASLRGESVPVIDLRGAIGMKPMGKDEESTLIITEYNRSIQGFLVGQIQNIINTTWADILPPPKAVGRHNYLTAITQVEVEPNTTRIVEIIDVEKVLAEIIEYDISISDGVLDQELVRHMYGRKVLIVDDSSTARTQVRNTLEQLGLEVIERTDGRQALELLKGWCDEGKVINDEILLMITDAEMPEMDGYRLTHEIRNDTRMHDLFITLNTSLSGSFNNAMVQKVGCDRFISKFQPDLIVGVVQERLAQII
ncbi:MULTISPECIES: chemotaxis protein CheV [unclassified Aliivibrio]|uniref:chemotaxis protein CheV n=1 Tax=unclassified Aliivibrio TaxID=2645654 RepID=UPI00080DB52A|nr:MULTISPECIES: chemotaxis protein CheV [unclassified Aliivibrio]OCH15142.1 chemotaxis protein CheW [Aliivibrio sp. 1S128]OCH16162.1 chemotaxis protein CheW [Aliivibrio sp. 1S165]OCH26983.1 chemotaxis protein CheW [Aliivibrio sp. 1S175]